MVSVSCVGWVVEVGMGDGGRVLDLDLYRMGGEERGATNFISLARENAFWQWEQVWDFSWELGLEDELDGEERS